MPRFLIEVPHADDELACARAIKVFMQSGSHYLTQCEWGCKDGDHSGWIMIESDSRDDAEKIVPPAYRNDARIVQLDRFTMEYIDEVLEAHGQSG